MLNIKLTLGGEGVGMRCEYVEVAVFIVQSQSHVLLLALALVLRVGEGGFCCHKSCRC